MKLHHALLILTAVTVICLLLRHQLDKKHGFDKKNSTEKQTSKTTTEDDPQINIAYTLDDYEVNEEELELNTTDKGYRYTITYTKE